MLIRRYLSTAILLILLAATLPAAPAQGGVVASVASGNWQTPSTWSCGCVPTRADQLTVRRGHTVTISGNVEAGSLTIEGVLRASRAAHSTLTLFGNLIVQATGWLDYGTASSPIPGTVGAKIQWVLDERRYVGGDTMRPLSTDVGLWVIGQGRVTTSGDPRDAWSPLVASVSRGAVQIAVDPRHGGNWRVGDTIVIGPSDNAAGQMPTQQDERRTITAVLGAGRYALSAQLAYNHPVITVSWTDPWGDVQTETMAPPVANLTRNVTFRGTDPNHRPHFMVMEQAHVTLEDLAIVGFSPAPRRIGTCGDPRRPHPVPFSRYALHFHRQRDGSRGSRVASVAIYDGAGDGIHAHDSYGVLVEDVVVYNQGRAVISDDMSRQHGHGIYLEASTMVRGHNTCAPVPDSGAREWRIDRPLVMKWGPATGCLRCSGIWLGFGPGAYVLGAYASGGRAVGIHWCEGCGNPGSTYLPNEERVPRVLRATASGNLEGFFWWTNQTPEQAIVDLLSFGNNIGFDLGAYSVRWWVYGPRAIGNRQVQFLHHAAGTRFTGFLADGRGNGSDGIWIAPYSTPSSDDTLYEAGVIRGTGTAATFEPCLQSRACGSELTLMQFNRVIFTGNPLLRFVNHPNVLSTWRIRDQAGLTRPGRFTLYHPNRVGVGGVYDTNYIALRVDNDSTSTLLRAPRARWSTATGCARDEDAVGDRPTLCLATDARTVEFYVENNIVATVLVVAGIAATRIDLSTWPHRRAYVYARAIGTNGRSNYSRVLRLISNP